MKFMIAPDSYKESMTAASAAKAIERGIKNIMPEAQCEILPMADGGEGTAESLMYGKDAEILPCDVTGPLGGRIQAHLIWFRQTASVLIEVSMACGLMLIPPEKRDPKVATSYGVGEMICKALELRPGEIMISLGGTGTSDGGAGMLTALGARILDDKGLPVGSGASALACVASVDLSEPVRRLKNVKITVLYDVKNPLLGKEGATYVFAPQKGAGSSELPALENAMGHYAAAVEQACHRELSNLEGAGAAGGIGFALLAVSQANFVSGSEFVMDVLALEQKIQDCDYVITGEGSIDSQSLSGKVPIGIARLAKRYRKPVLVFAGRIGKNTGRLYEYGITAIFCILNELDSLGTVLAHGEYNLQTAVENVMRLLRSVGEQQRAFPGKEGALKERSGITPAPTDTGTGEKRGD